MWYGGNDGTYTQIGHATSLDGVTWEKDMLNPVFTVGTSGDWDDLTVDGPSVLFDGHTYHMWYAGGKQDAWDWKTGYAYSFDGMNWVNDSDDNPVLDLGNPGSWDDTFVGAGGCEVISKSDSIGFKMWYGGGSGTAIGDIGYAISGFIESVIDYKPGELPQGLSLLQNYPNPFNPSTTIEFSLPKSEFVELKIYNILGKELTTLVSKKLNQGNHTYTFDGKNLASGVYYYQLVAGDYREVKKMILLK
jgi:hypothetical protein